jgi:hypothetical protein
MRLLGGGDELAGSVLGRRGPARSPAGPGYPLSGWVCPLREWSTLSRGESRARGARQAPDNCSSCGAGGPGARGDHRVAGAHRSADEFGLHRALRGSRLLDRQLYRFEVQTGHLESQARLEPVIPIRASWIPRSRSTSATSAANRSARSWARSADLMTDQLVAVRVSRCGCGETSSAGADAYSHRIGSPSAGTSTYRSIRCSVRTGMVEVPETHRASTGSTSSAAAGSWQRGAGRDQRVFHGPADRRGVHVGLCLTGPGRRDRPRHVVPGSGGPAEGRARCTGHAGSPPQVRGRGPPGVRSVSGTPSVRGWERRRRSRGRPASAAGPRPVAGPCSIASPRPPCGHQAGPW